MPSRALLRVSQRVSIWCHVRHRSMLTHSRCNWWWQRRTCLPDQHRSAHQLPRRRLPSHHRPHQDLRLHWYRGQGYLLRLPPMGYRLGLPDRHQPERMVRQLPGQRSQGWQHHLRQGRCTRNHRQEQQVYHRPRHQGCYEGQGSPHDWRRQEHHHPEHPHY